MRSLQSKNISLFKFSLKVCKIKVRKMKVNVVITIIIEYASICLNLSKCLNMLGRVLNISCVQICQDSEYARALNMQVTQGSKYATIWLNMSG